MKKDDTMKQPYQTQHMDSFVECRLDPTTCITAKEANDLFMARGQRVSSILELTDSNSPVVHRKVPKSCNSPLNSILQRGDDITDITISSACRGSYSYPHQSTATRNVSSSSDDKGKEKEVDIIKVKGTEKSHGDNGIILHIPPRALNRRMSRRVSGSVYPTFHSSTFSSKGSEEDIVKVDIERQGPLFMSSTPRPIYQGNMKDRQQNIMSHKHTDRNDSESEILCEEPTTYSTSYVTPSHTKFSIYHSNLGHKHQDHARWSPHSEKFTRGGTFGTASRPDISSTTGVPGPDTYRYDHLDIIGKSKNKFFISKLSREYGSNASSLKHTIRPSSIIAEPVYANPRNSRSPSQTHTPYGESLVPDIPNKGNGPKSETEWSPALVMLDWSGTNKGLMSSIGFDMALASCKLRLLRYQKIKQQQAVKASSACDKGSDIINGLQTSRPSCHSITIPDSSTVGEELITRNGMVFRMKDMLNGCPVALAPNYYNPSMCTVSMDHNTYLQEKENQIYTNDTKGKRVDTNGTSAMVSSKCYSIPRAHRFSSRTDVVQGMQMKDQRNPIKRSVSSNHTRQCYRPLEYVELKMVQGRIKAIDQYGDSFRGNGELFNVTENDPYIPHESPECNPAYCAMAADQMLRNASEFVVFPFPSTSHERLFKKTNTSRHMTPHHIRPKQNRIDFDSNVSAPVINLREKTTSHIYA